MKFPLLPFLLLFISSASAQTTSFRALRYDEDYSHLKTDSSTCGYNKLKYQPLGSNGKNYVSFGADFRMQYFKIGHENWGDVAPDNDGFIFCRFLVHSDIHVGKHFRSFIQLQSSLVNSRPNSSPVDEDPLELHQAFADIDLMAKNKSNLLLRAGRQEFLFGSQRLVSVREGPNNRQSFDAARFIYTKKHYRLDVFYSQYVAARKGIFDDQFNGNTKFWGVYLVRNNQSLFRNFDLYYLGFQKRKAFYDAGAGKEVRHSFGTRIWGSNAGWRYDVEALYQAGKLDDKNIRAWTASFNGGHTFIKTKLKPDIGLKTDIISGDHDPADGTLQSFNPLFPRGGYFGLASLIGPSNLIDVHPSVGITPLKKVVWNVECDLFWRYSTQDGIYTPGMNIIYPGKTSSAKHIGQQYSTDVVYTPGDQLFLRVEYTFFKAGQFLKNAGTGKNISFLGITLQLRI